MLNIKQAYELLRVFLVRELNGKIQHNNWIEFRGDRFCDECHRHRRSALYMYVEEGSTLFVKCFRASCSLKRAITAQDLIDLGFKNTEAIKLLINSSERSKFVYKDLEFKVNNIIVTKIRFSIEQENYFYKRTGFIPNKSDMDIFRLIPDIRGLIHDNFVTLDGINNKYESFLNNFKKFFNKYNKSEYISYFTNDGNKFYFRSIDDNTNSIKKGQLSLTDNKSLYTVQKGDIVENLVITEGIFDLINVYKSFHIGNNAIFTSTGGFAAFEYHIISLYKKHMDTLKNLYIYCDSDVYKEDIDRYDINFEMLNTMFRNLFKRIPIIAFEKIYIIHNTHSKDFGDLSLKIRKKTYLVDVNDLDKKYGKINLINV